MIYMIGRKLMTVVKVEQLLDRQCLLQGAQRYLQARSPNSQQRAFQRQVHRKDYWWLCSILCLSWKGQDYSIQACELINSPLRCIH